MSIRFEALKHVAEYKTDAEGREAARCDYRLLMRIVICPSVKKNWRKTAMPLTPAEMGQAIKAWNATLDRLGETSEFGASKAQLSVAFAAAMLAMLEQKKLMLEVDTETRTARFCPFF